MNLESWFEVDEYTQKNKAAPTSSLNGCTESDCSNYSDIRLNSSFLLHFIFFSLLSLEIHTFDLTCSTSLSFYTDPKLCVMTFRRHNMVRPRGTSLRNNWVELTDCSVDCDRIAWIVSTFIEIWPICSKLCEIECSFVRSCSFCNELRRNGVVFQYYEQLWAVDTTRSQLLVLSA